MEGGALEEYELSYAEAAYEYTWEHAPMRLMALEK